MPSAVQLIKLNDKMNQNKKIEFKSIEKHFELTNLLIKNGLK